MEGDRSWSSQTDFQGNEVLEIQDSTQNISSRKRPRIKFDRDCAVCHDQATGFHYKAPTCEGCKGFFRRSIQGNLFYMCVTGLENCAISRATRTSCQKCRFNKCIEVGMTPQMVLNERQRIAKRQMIQENRFHRRQNESWNVDFPRNDVFDDSHKQLLATLLAAYTYFFPRKGFSQKALDANMLMFQPGTSVRVLDLLTVSIDRVADFAKNIPGFCSLTTTDRMCLLQSSCFEVLCLRVALRYDANFDSFPLRQNYILTRDYATAITQLAELSRPLFNYAEALEKPALDDTEAALVVSTLLLHATRPGLEEPERVDLYREAVLTAGAHYTKTKYPNDDLRWSTILLSLSTLRHISVLLSEQVIDVPTASPHCLPMTVLQLFEEDPPTET